MTLKVARDRLLALLRRGARAVSSRARHAAGVAGGAVTEARSKVARDDRGGLLDDATLARKVESEIFRESKVPKGAVVVNAVDGVVWLRGEASTPEAIEDLVSRAERVPEVRKVENLLRLPGTPSPTRSDSPEGARRDPGSDELDPREPVVPSPVTQERGTGAGEPSPAEGRARRPAPLGSEDEEEKG
jgi:hypothetical protein